MFSRRTVAHRPSHELGMIGEFERAEPAATILASAHIYTSLARRMSAFEARQPDLIENVFRLRHSYLQGSLRTCLHELK